MEVHLTPKKEARLHQFATRTGREVAQVVEEAVDRLLEYDAHFVREVEKGLAQIERGEVLSHIESRPSAVVPRYSEGKARKRTAVDFIVV